MKREKFAWILAITVLLVFVLPNIAEGQENIPALGKWKVQGLGLVFEPNYEALQTYSSKNSFRVEPAEGIRATVTGVFTTTGVFIYYENDTANATQIFPDRAGIYIFELPQRGEYTLVFISASSLQSIPVMGSVCASIAPSSSVQIKIVYKFNWMPVIALLIVILAIAMIALVAYSIYKKRKRKKGEEVGAGA